MKEAILPTLPGMGLALGSVITFVAATGWLAGVGFYSKKLCDFHEFSPVSLLGTPEDNDGAQFVEISLLDIRMVSF